jgi:ankyrin repeat protein
LVFYSIKFNYIKLLEFIEILPYFENKDESNLLHYICQWGNRNEFLLNLFKSEQYLSVIDKKKYVKNDFLISNESWSSRFLDISQNNKGIHWPVMVQTPLHVACISANFEAVKILIDKDANVKLVSNIGCNALHYAAFRGHLDIVRLLIKSGAALNVSDSAKQNELHYAVMGVINRELVKFLLDAGSFISVEHFRHLSPLDIAVMRNQLGIVQLLAKKKNFKSLKLFKDRLAIACLHACIFYYPELIDYFLNMGVLVDKLDFNNSSNLHILSLLNVVESFELLLKNGVNVNGKDSTGCSPLHVAAAAGNLKIVKLLLDSGANINAQNNLGGTPLYIATFYKKLRTVEFLKKKGADSTLADIYGITPDLLVLLKLYKNEDDLLTLTPKQILTTITNMGGNYLS